VDKKIGQEDSVHAETGIVRQDSAVFNSKKQPASAETSPLAQANVKDKSKISGRQAAASKSSNKKTVRMDSLHFVQGLVIDDSGKAIESATVKLSGEDIATTTDSNGYFKLQFDKEKKNQELAINSLGFKSVRAAAPTDSSLLTYKMRNNPGQLNEVVVTGYGIKRRTEVTGSVSGVSSRNIQPDEWQALNKYINENKKINSADSLLKGEEIISFEVNKKGKMSSIKVIKSISSSHDAEVIRLLKSGLKLYPVEGKKQKCQISIFF
jgi:hypothetical protein